MDRDTSISPAREEAFGCLLSVQDRDLQIMATNVMTVGSGHVQKQWKSTPVLVNISDLEQQK